MSNRRNKKMAKHEATLPATKSPKTHGLIDEMKSDVREVMDAFTKVVEDAAATATRKLKTRLEHLSMRIKGGVRT